MEGRLGRKTVGLIRKLTRLRADELENILPKHWNRSVTLNTMVQARHVVLLLGLARRHTMAGGRNGRRVARMVSGGSTRVGSTLAVTTHKDGG